MIKGKMSTMICIILAIIIVALLIQAGMNKGKLWGEQEYFQACCDIASGQSGSCVPSSSVNCGTNEECKEKKCGLCVRCGTKSKK